MKPLLTLYTYTFAVSAEVVKNNTGDVSMTKERLRVIMGENIRNERMARNMSIDELAELLELTSGFVGLIERGRRGATAHTLLKLSDIFGMPIDNIFLTPENTARTFEEGSFRKSKTKRNKIASLISDLAEVELDFVIRMIKGLKSMNHTRILRENDEEEESDDTE
jgi:transcriptional regulator with XRE-family HTH domain